MKGLGRMIIALSTLGATLACQGCVQAMPGTEVAASGPAAAPSIGMQMAAPTALGQTSAPSTSIDTEALLAQAPTSFGTTTIINAPVQLSGDPLEPTDYKTTFAAIDPAPLSAQSWSSSDALTLLAADKAEAALLEPQDEVRNIGAEIAFAAPSERTGLAFDVGIAPRVGYTDDGAFQTSTFGGELRIGQNFDQRGNEYTPKGSWYVFAGADGEAVVWDTGRNADVNAMALTDQVTVGDMQAGVSVQRGGGQLSLSYIRREVEYKDRNGGMSENEDFAGVSFTLRR